MRERKTRNVAMEQRLDCNCNLGWRPAAALARAYQKGMVMAIELSTAFLLLSDVVSALDNQSHIVGRLSAARDLKWRVRNTLKSDGHCTTYDARRLYSKLQYSTVLYSTLLQRLD